MKILFGLLALSAALSGGDPIDDALHGFRSLQSYSVTLRAETNRSEIIKYHYKKPGYVRMEFEEPHKGAILVYDPLSKEVTLRPFGFLKSFKMKLSPESKLIRSSRGHTVDESDIGALLEAVDKLRDNGTVEVKGAQEAAGKMAAIVEVRGKEGYAVDGINLYRLWLDEESRLPVKVEAYGNGGEVLERVEMHGLEVDPEFPAGFFKLE